MKFSPRLQALLERCSPNLPLWDLCCDHGLLGIEALNRGFPAVVFNDAVPHVLASLRTRLGETANCRFIEGPAETIPEPLTGNVVIAGVGGEKIFNILISSTLLAERLVLCPEKDAEWLMEQEIPGYRRIEQTSIPHGQGQRWILAYIPHPRC